MSRHLSRELLAQHADIRQLPRPEATVDRTFGLPKQLYIATVALYLGFLAVMGVGFATPGLAIPMAIFAFFIVAGFGLPALWTTMQPDNPSRPLAWGHFASEGIMTLTGRVRAADAAVQVLILPALILLWGAAVVTIAALI